MYIRCPECGTEWRDGNRFCVGCGWPEPDQPPLRPEPIAAASCHKCGVALEQGKRFCPSCGSSQSKEQAVPTKATQRAKSAKTRSTAAESLAKPAPPEYEPEQAKKLVTEEPPPPLPSDATAKTTSDSEACPSCGAAWRTGGQFCTKCGFTADVAGQAPNQPDHESDAGIDSDSLNDGEQLVHSAVGDGYLDASTKVSWPILATIVGALIIVGVAAVYMKNNEEVDNDAAVAQQEAATIPFAEASANPGGSAAIDAASPTSIQRLQVSGIYSGNLKGQLVFLSLNEDAPREMMLANGSARYLQGTELLCDTVIASAAAANDGLVRLEQRPSGNGKACPKNYPIILEMADGTNFINGTADKVQATWLHPENGQVMGSSVLKL